MLTFSSMKRVRVNTCLFASFSVAKKEVHKLQVYGFRISQPSRSVLLLCNEGKLNYNFNEIDARKMEHLTPEFKKMHPTGLLPVINDDGFVLGESAAILAYLAEANGLTDFYPFCLQSRAKINFWMHWHHKNTRKGAEQLFFPTLVMPMKTPAEQEAMIKKGQKSFSKACKFLNNHFETQKTKYLVDSKHPSIADLLLLPELDELSKDAADLFDYTPYPHVQQYISTLQHDLKTYAENFKPVQEVTRKFKETGRAHFAK